MARGADGSAYSWGAGSDGRLGLGDSENRSETKWFLANKIRSLCVPSTVESIHRCMIRASSFVIPLPTHLVWCQIQVVKLVLGGGGTG
jgi:hypothetical protein